MTPQYEQSIHLMAAKGSKAKRPYEQKSSKGDFRNPYQHDRDRIIHSRTFKRLLNKTQVFVIYEGDHYRTRLTHTLEVSQISRSVARALNLNEDLTEAISLGHDLGHTPFGHTGEKVLHEIMSGEDLLGDKLQYYKQNEIYLGGFRHNWQSLRIVDLLEKKYTNINGLNLTNDTREGILKHSSLKMKGKFSDIDYGKVEDKEILNIDNKHCSFIEGQVVELADEIAQRTHDLEDGFRSGLIDYTDIENVELVERARTMGNLKKPKNRRDFLPMGMIVRNLIHLLIVDLVDHSQKLMNQWMTENRIQTPEDFYEKKGDIIKLVTLDREMREKFKELDSTITDHIINSETVNRMDARAQYFIKDLFKAYFNEPRQLPSYLLHRYQHFHEKPYLRRVKSSETKQTIKQFQKDKNFIRLICDHIAGMTDNFALSEHQKLYLSSPPVQVPA